MMHSMRTTVRVDDELLEELKARAERENVSLTRLLNRTIRAGLRAAEGRPARPLYREVTSEMGTPRLAVTKALALAAALDDEETLRELAVRK